jgi:hypothetical protein
LLEPQDVLFTGSLNHKLQTNPMPNKMENINVDSESFFRKGSSFALSFVFNMAFISKMKIGNIRKINSWLAEIKFNAVKAAVPSNPDTIRSE